MQSGLLRLAHIGFTNRSRVLTHSGKTAGFLGVDLYVAVAIVGLARYACVSPVFGSNAIPMISPARLIEQAVNRSKDVVPATRLLRSTSLPFWRMKPRRMLKSALAE